MFLGVWKYDIGVVFVELVEFGLCVGENFV